MSHPAEVQEFTFTIPDTHPCLPGHFPGEPLVPGVLVMDEVIGGSERVFGGALCVRGISQVKFVSTLRPDQLANVRVELRAPEQLRFTVHHAETLIAQGVLRLGTDESLASTDPTLHKS